MTHPNRIYVFLILICAGLLAASRRSNPLLLKPINKAPSPLWGFVSLTALAGWISLSLDLTCPNFPSMQGLASVA